MIRRTIAALPVELSTLPISPLSSPPWPSEAMTGMSASMPEELPLSIVILAYQSVGDWPVTRAVCGP